MADAISRLGTTNATEASNHEKYYQMRKIYEDNVQVTIKLDVII